MPALQTPLILCKSPLSPQLLHHHHRLRHYPLHRPFPFSNSRSIFHKSQFLPHILSLPCSLHSESETGAESTHFSDRDDVSETKESESLEVAVESEESGGNLGALEEKWRKVPILGFLIGVWVAISRAYQNLCRWWNNARWEVILEPLIAEADANPMDAAKQSELLAELNKHDPESALERFEKREYAVDSRGVAEYIRALVETGRLFEYLPDEKSEKPGSLPALLQELKQYASGNTDEALQNPGISQRQPLHVLMVDPKDSTKSRAKDFFSFLKGFDILLWLVVIAVCSRYADSLNGGMGASGFGSVFSYSPKELNKEAMPQKNVKTFKDVKGCDEAKAELEEVVEYLKNPSKFTRLGGELPKGILLTGSPGTGKTLLAKAIAGEAGVPFFYAAGSEFEEKLVGVGAQRVRSLFEAAKKKPPCILFIDEIDAIGSSRKKWDGYANSTLHQLLVEMDGFEQNEGIILIAATNFPEILDPALTRPGRFDRHIVVPNPDVKGRQEILELYVQDKPLDEDVDVKSLARGTPGFTGADLANLVNIAAIKAAVEGSELIAAAQLEFAKDRILMGTERSTMYISEDSKKLTAYHESGHAIVALNTEGAHPIHKATIVPHGSALGMVTQLPPSDETKITKKQLLARLDVCMGGRVAEELIFGKDHITTGAGSDLESATELAHHMVTRWGMSDRIGPVHVREKSSAEMLSRIDDEVMRLLKEACDRVRALLKKHEKALHALANALMEYETLTAEEIMRILHTDREGEVAEQQQEGEFALA